MRHLKNITRNRKNKYLNEKERIKIEALLDKGYKSSEIAKQLGRSKSTICREIKRGTVVLKQYDLSEKAIYRYDHRQIKYIELQENKVRPLKIGYDYTLSRYIEDKILNNKYSPAAIIGEIKQKRLVFKEMICARTLYNYVDMGIFVGISASDLPYKKKQKKKTKKDGKIAKCRVEFFRLFLN
ncbi:MAG: transposase [Candidatus Goldiibacteriota bacterium]